MAMPAPVDQTLLDDAVRMARAAGAATLEWFQARELDIDEKSDGTPVTIADRTAERIIREELASAYPDDAVLGEEEGAAEGSGRRRWIIDPIDGTLSFVHGVPLYGTLLAVEDEHGIAAGVIDHPALGETVWAGRGRGCFLNGEPTGVNDNARLETAVLSTSDFTAMPPDMMRSVHESPLLLRTWGDAYGYTLVATGRMEAMIDPIVNVWDVAPMAVIIPEAGGRFSTLDGRFSYTAGNAMATNGLLHEKVRAILGGEKP
jgi:histidinol-phosphatase